MRGRRIQKPRKTRGGALIIALLVVLVLTIVGLGVAYFTQLEDQTSGNIRLAKSAFYAAESGLRSGERAITLANSFGATVTELISYTGGTPIGLPGGGGQGIPLYVRGRTFDRVTLTAAAGTSDVAFFTLYVRNNIEDPGNSTIPVTDTDNTINLVAVGQVWTGVDGSGRPSGRLLATKVLEEQIKITAEGKGAPDQEDTDPGGTNTGEAGG
jgi:hypothetical protein